MHASISGLLIFMAIFPVPVISSLVHFIAILTCNHKSLMTSAVGASNRSCAYPMKTTWQGDCFVFLTWEKTALACTPRAKKNNSSLCDSIRSHLFVQKHVLRLGCSYDNKTKHMLHVLQLLMLMFVEGAGSDFTQGTLVPGRALVECRHFREKCHRCLSS